MASLFAVFKAQDKISGNLKNMGNQGKSLTSTLGKVAGAAAAAFSVKKVVDFGAACSSAATGLESGMAEVFTLLPGITEDSMADMTKQVRDFAKETGTATTDTIPALYSALSAGVPKDNVFSFLESANSLAVGGVASLDDSVATLSTITNNYAKDGLEASTASDMLFTTVKNGVTTISELSANLGNVVPSAASAGVGFNEVSAAMATMTASLGAGSTAVASTKLRTMFDELTKTGTTADKTFRQIAGQSFSEFTAAGGTTAEALKKLKGYADENDLSIKELFNSTEAGTAALILGSSAADKFSSNMDAMANSAGATDEAYATMEDTVAHKTDLLKAKFEDIKLGIGETINKGLGKFLDFALVTVDDSLEAFDKLVKYFKSNSLSDVIGDMFGDGAADLVKKGQRMGGDILAGIKKALSGDVSGIFDIGALLGIDQKTISNYMGYVFTIKTNIETVINNLKPILQDVANESVNIFETVSTYVGPLLNKISNLYPIIGDIVTTLTNSLMPAVRTVFDTVTNTIMPKIMGVVDKVAPKVINLVDAVVDAIGSIWTFVKPILTTAIANGTKAFKLLAKNLSPVISDIGDIIGGIVDALSGIITFVSGVFSGDWDKAWRGIKETFSGIFDSLHGIFSGAMDLISGVFSSFGPTISAAWDTLWTGLKQAFSRIWSLITGIYEKPIKRIQFIFTVFKTWITTKWTIVWTTLKTTLSTVWGGVKSIFAKPVNWITSKVTSFKETITGAWSGIWSGMKSTMSRIWDGVSSLFKAPLNTIIKGFNSFTSSLSKIKVPDWVPGVGGRGVSIDPLPLLAKGSLNAPDAYIAGEAGPELIVGAAGSKVFSNKKTTNMLEDANNATSIAAPKSAYNRNTASQNDTSTETHKVIDININGQGSISTDAKGADKETILQVLIDNIKTVLIDLLDTEILEEGDLAYEY